MVASRADMIANPGNRRVNFLHRNYVGNVEGEAEGLRFSIADFRLVLPKKDPGGLREAAVPS